MLALGETLVTDLGLARRLSGLARFSPKSPVLDHGNNPKSE
jgi:hypothetical protein